jgi:hypothetical protein
VVPLVEKYRKKNQQYEQNLEQAEQASLLIEASFST